MSSAPASPPQPVALTLHQASRVLEIAFDDGASFRIPFELMRVYSPSAEVQGHGPGQEVLQTGKREVGIDEISCRRPLRGAAPLFRRPRKRHLQLALPLPPGRRAGRALAALRTAPGRGRHGPRRADDTGRPAAPAPATEPEPSPSTSTPWRKRISATRPSTMPTRRAACAACSTAWPRATTS